MTDIVSRTEAAVLLGVDERSVRRYESGGRLPKAAIQSSRGGLKRAFYPRASVLELKRALEVEAFTRQSDEQKRRDFAKALEDEKAYEKFADLEAAALEFELAELRKKWAIDAEEADARAAEYERERIRRAEYAEPRQRAECEAIASDSQPIMMTVLAGVVALGTLAAAAWAG